MRASREAQAVHCQRTLEAVVQTPDCTAPDLTDVEQILAANLLHLDDTGRRPGTRLAAATDTGLNRPLISTRGVSMPRPRLADGVPKERWLKRGICWRLCWISACGATKG